VSKVLVFSLAVSCSVAFPRNINQYDYFKCPNVMQAHHLTRGFPGVVAHGLHSISLEDLQYYFDASASKDNHVPTINLDLVSEHAVLGYAPSVCLDHPFPSQFMRAVDQVLSHMDDPNYDVKKYSTFERLVHVMHMNEMWKMAKPHYDKLVANPPKDPRICPCVNDVENNGILDMLNFMALKIREPELMYGHHLTRYEGSDRLKLEALEDKDKLDWHDIDYYFGKDGHQSNQKPIKENMDWENNVYKFPSPTHQEKLDWHDIDYYFGKDGNLYQFDFKNDDDDDDKDTKTHSKKAPEENLDWEGNLYQFDFNKNEPNPPTNPHEKLDWHDIDYYFGKDGQKNTQKSIQKRSVDSDEPTRDNFAKQKGMPKLSSETAWKYWKNEISGMEEISDYELAMFLYCALNHN
ncbi:hypothetical protein TCAL_17443, partial [Tigriopus californicus]